MVVIVDDLEGARNKKQSGSHRGGPLSAYFFL